MTEKLKITKEQVVASSGAWVTFMDAGGTLRKAKSSLVEIVEELTEDKLPSQEAEDAATGSSDSNDAPVAESQQADAAEPTTEASPETPPSSETPTEPQEAADESKPTKSRKKTMNTATRTAPKKATKAPPKAVAKKAAPPKRTNGNGDASGIRTIGGKAVDLSRYEKAKAPGGGTSYHNGDAVAEKLAGKSLNDVYAQAAKILKTDEKELRKKYGHLNVGMQRMALGNRMRKVMIPKEAR